MEVHQPVAFANAADPTCRTVQLALTAVAEALADAGNPHLNPALRLGVCLGTTVASQLNNIPFYDAFRRTGAPPLEAVQAYLNSNLAQAVARHIGARGPRATIVNACSSGADAIGVGLNWLAAGLCDAVVAGGADELNRVPLVGFHSLGIVSDVPCQPFDRNRRGLNLGEGAGVVVLETAASCRARGLSPRLAAASFGAGCDAHHLTAPHPKGVGLHAAISAALARADIAPADIAFVNAHGTGTADNDAVEGAVLGRIFGPSVPFLSTKGLTGHTLGAAGGIEAVLTALGLHEGWIPASAGFREPDPAIPIAPITARTQITGRYAMSTSLAFGGNNAAMIIARVD
jgi:3-oxoacyl-(acyl-carrier-protein) synthase